MQIYSGIRIGGNQGARYNLNVKINNLAIHGQCTILTPCTCMWVFSKIILIWCTLYMVMLTT